MVSPPTLEFCGVSSKSLLQSLSQWPLTNAAVIDMVDDMEVNKVADKVSDMVADVVADKKNGRHLVGHGARHSG